jgi:hypothetical protein
MRHFFLLVAILSSLPSVGRTGPVPYSEERYSVIWHEAFVFEKSSRGSSAPVSSEEWTVAGTFTLGDAHGAVVINRLNGSIEYLNTLSPSPSGIRLTAILGDVGGASLRIAVTSKGKAMVLTGSTAETSVPETVPLKYVPTVIPSPAASTASVD